MGGARRKVAADSHGAEGQWEEWRVRGQAEVTGAPRYVPTGLDALCGGLGGEVCGCRG